MVVVKVAMSVIAPMVMVIVMVGVGMLGLAQRCIITSSAAWIGCEVMVEEMGAVVSIVQLVL